MIFNSIRSGNIGKSIESFHLLNPNNNLNHTKNSEPNNIINYNEKEKENKRDILILWICKSCRIQYKLENEDNKNMIRINFI